MGKGSSGQRRAEKVRARRHRQVTRQTRQQAAHEAEEEFDGLVGLVTEDLEHAIGLTVTEHSREPAERLVDAIWSNDESVAQDIAAGTGPPTAADIRPADRHVGKTVAALVLAGWLISVGAKYNDGQMPSRLTESARAMLGDECANAAAEAAAALGAASDSRDLAGQLLESPERRLLTGLIWLCCGAVAQYGDGDVTWLYDHEEAFDAFGL